MYSVQVYLTRCVLILGVIVSVGIYYEMKMVSSTCNNQSYKGIFSYFFLHIGGHSKHYFSYVMQEYPVTTNCHEQTLKIEGDTTQVSKEGRQKDKQ